MRCLELAWQDSGGGLMDDRCGSLVRGSCRVHHLFTVWCETHIHHGLLVAVCFTCRARVLLLLLLLQDEITLVKLHLKNRQWKRLVCSVGRRLHVDHFVICLQVVVVAEDDLFTTLLKRDIKARGRWQADTTRFLGRERGRVARITAIMIARILR